MSKTALSIRFATPDDAETIHLGLKMIETATHQQGKVTSTPDDLRRYGFSDPPSFLTLIAEIDGQFAGMSLFFRSFSTWRGMPGAYIQDFVVVDAFRGKGVAEALLKASAREAKKAFGARYLRLAVDVDNHRARRFYESMGLTWSRSEAIHAAYGAYFQALAAEKDME